MNRQPLHPIADIEIDTFHRDGVVCVRGLLDDDWIDRMQRATDRLLDKPSPRGGDLNEDGTEGRFAYDNYLWTFDDDFRAAAFESPIAEAAAAFMRSTGVNVIFDFILVKEPLTPKVTRWHQDMPANACRGSQTCGVWVSLDHATVESGALESIKGSHRWPPYRIASSSDPTRHKYLQGYGADSATDAGGAETEALLPDIENNRDAYDIVSFETEPGDCLFSSLMTTHGARGNATDQRRRAFGYKLVGDDATYAVRRGKFAIKPLVDPHLEHGESFPDDPDHPVFPQLWSGPGRSHAATPTER